VPSIRAFHVHAFSAEVHGGSPAGVCLLDGPLADEAIRAIARDLGPSVSAFVWPEEGGKRALRWFTRAGAEVQTYCGHATFAAAHIAFGEVGAAVEFETISGPRRAKRNGERITLEIPIWPVTKEPCPAAVAAAINQVPVAYYQGERDRLLVYAEPDEVRALEPDFAKLNELGDFGFICAARSDDEIVFRFFCPGFDIGEDEDPATGSAQSTLAPFWMDRLDLSRLTTRQASGRGAVFQIERDGDRLTVTAPCATFFEGVIHV